MKKLVAMINILSVLGLAACGRQEYSPGIISNLADTAPMGATDQNKPPSTSDAKSKKRSLPGGNVSADPESKSSEETEKKSCEKSGESDQDDDHEDDDEEVRHADDQRHELDDVSCSK